MVKGTVTRLQPYDAFVDLGGVEGMLHVSELGFSRVGHPEDVLSVGQQVEVVVLKLEEGEGKGGKKVERISQSLKALATDPWQDVAKGLVEGALLKGTITRLQQFGAFVEVAPGV